MNQKLESICVRCPEVDWTCATCKQNSRYFVDNCADGQCPIGKFVAGEVNPLAALIPDDYVPTPQNAIEGRCGC